MAEHNELVAELPILEQMGTQERQKLAKKRRLHQLKKWSQREKEYIAKEKQLNKRLASKYHEENNGLSLKQYTTYNSNKRTKNRPLVSTKGATIDEVDNSVINGRFTSRSDSSNNNDHDVHNNNHIDNIRLRATKTVIEASSSTTRGKVHFNSGIMLLEAAARNDYDDVKRLLMLGVSPDSVNHDGLTALHQCCIDASEPIMTLLLEFGANVNAKDTEQWTPLHAACTCGHPNLVEILVENGANLLAVNGDGNLPLDICEDETTLDYLESQMLKQGVTQELIDLTRASKEASMLKDLERALAEGRDLNAADEQGVTALHVAAANNYSSVVKFLLKQNVNVSACDNDLWQPIHGAVCWGNEQYYNIIELLVDHGASLNAKTINDETVFELCDNMELLEKLTQLKEDLEKKRSVNTNQLKRTQSKSNSRILSVRRTSVRDKNQISRREAREEALLRTEGRIDTTDGPTTNGTTSNNPSTDMDVTNSGLVIVTDPTGTTTINGKSVESDYQTGTSSTRADATSDRTNHVSDVFESSLNGDRQLQMDNFESSNASSSSDISEPHRYTKSLPQHINGASITASNNSHSSKSDQLHSIARNAASNQRNIEEPDTPSDPSTKEQKQQLQPIVVQFAPTNYTLSNLKKQRSDMRMRSSSIGASNQDPCDKENVVKNHVTLVINPKIGQYSDSQDNSTPNGLNISGPTTRVLKTKTSSLNTSINTGREFTRSQSPNSTFRKFSGEPSDAIVGFGRKNRYKCCTVM